MENEEYELNSLSKRGQNYLKPDPLFSIFLQVLENPYDPITKKGVLNLGVAENVLTHDLMLKKIEEIESKHLLKIPQHFNYVDFRGIQKLRKNLSLYFEKFVFNSCNKTNDKEKIFKFNFNEENFVTMCGAGCCIEQISETICDVNDYVLIPSPHYHAFSNDLGKRFGAKVLPFSLKRFLIEDKCNKKWSSFKIDFEELNSVYEKAKKEGKNIKSLIFVNPHNPSGVIFGEDEMFELMKWCLKRKIHYVSDEIYCNSIFENNGGKKFKSIFEIILNKNDSNLKDIDIKTYVHIIYSFSKDFGINGFRGGVFFSLNSMLLRSISSNGYFNQQSSHTQLILADILENHQFLEKYLIENNKRITKAYNSSIEAIEKCGVSSDKIFHSESSMFIYIHLTELMPKDIKRDFENTKKLWKHLIEKQQVNILPALLFNGKEFGWFRICFTCGKQDVVNKGIQKCIQAAQNFKL